MNFNEYQEKIKSFYIFPEKVKAAYILAGAISEFSELFGKLKPIFDNIDDGDQSKFGQIIKYCVTMMSKFDGIIGREVKALRDKPLNKEDENWAQLLNEQLEKTDFQEIIKELGDNIWFLASIATVLGVNFGDVAAANIKKLEDRIARNVIKGSGDNR